MKKTTLLHAIREVLIWIFGLYLAYIFLVQGWNKLDPEGFWKKAFDKWGYSTSFMYFTGVMEILGALFLLIPRTSFYGGATLAIVMIGAFITKAVHGSGVWDLIWIAIFMIVAGTIAILRHRIRWRFKKRKPS